jgi:hypothetical protein
MDPAELAVSTGLSRYNGKLLRLDVISQKDVA